MEDIKKVLDSYQSDSDKIAFLLRQLEIALKAKEYYREIVFRKKDE